MFRDVLERGGAALLVGGGIIHVMTPVRLIDMSGLVESPSPG